MISPTDSWYETDRDGSKARAAREEAEEGARHNEGMEMDEIDLDKDDDNGSDSDGGNSSVASSIRKDNY